MISPRILLLLGIWNCHVVVAQDSVLVSKRLHLGKPGQWEWDSFKDRAVDAERLEVRFEAKANAVEHTLRLWQRDVKLGWPVLLNGRRLGTLTTAETAQECVLAVPAGALRDGENTLVVEAASQLDDIELGPVILAPKPVAEAIGGASMRVTVTDLGQGGALPCRLTLTRPDDTLQPLRAEPAGAVAARTGVVYTKNGSATIFAPPGDYILYAGRGF